MWTKSKFGNLITWSAWTQDKYYFLDQDGLDKVNDGSGKYELKYYGDKLYKEIVEGDIEQLPAGVYRYEVVNDTRVFVEYSLQQKDAILEFTTAEDVLKDFAVFKESRALYEELKQPYRRGVLIFGPPGTGKTFTLHKIADSVAQDEVLILFCDRQPNLSFITEFKKDKRLKIFIFEEFTNALRSDWEADSNMLDFLDGETALDNTFIIAVTNYPEKLPKNISNRPGRFDSFYKISFLSSADIKQYLEHYDIEPEECIVNKSDCTIAQLKDIMLLVKRDKLTIKQALSKIEKHEKLVEAEFVDNKKRMGFNTDDD